MNCVWGADDYEHGVEEKTGERGRQKKRRRRNRGNARNERRRKRSPVAMLYTGIQPGIVSRVYANLKDLPSRPASREGGSTQSGNFSAGWRPAVTVARDFIMSL